MTTHRSVTRLVRGLPATDGAGVKLTRVLGTQALPEVDPFLMLDEFRSDDPQAYIAGFPNHPHRGFETITYMLAGRMRHKDSKGNEGLLGPGDVQWMTTARGLVHSEMPEQEDGLMQGFQLWLNLPAREKMLDPQYKDVPANTIPVVRHSDAWVKLLAGTYQGQTGPIQSPTTKPFIADVSLDGGAALTLPVPAGHAGFAYVFDGDALITGQSVTRGQAAVLSDGAELPLTGGLGGARVLVVLGQPLKEPIARHGPFVMNTPQEIYQAFADYQAGRF
ncbi:pirin family protein [Asticcacaulis excentricus]|uniref:Pirin domain protein n=1 Tax=Asticcacaulis excentricus (strain ATCC 15261 / DSM 4724 / KCTC 12464 / NCIMB 9791 / VKM B-1370 / CB 48) TaxID=573065 RepID=E8RUX0_ASTEC|nr:pirin family protein [Asticcacaulis excentricus]ADU14170.1 Pirin domain protein [Asticcacaulis excentricus CB 48]